MRSVLAREAQLGGVSDDRARHICACLQLALDYGRCWEPPFQLCRCGTILSQRAGKSTFLGRKLAKYSHLLVPQPATKRGMRLRLGSASWASCYNLQRPMADYSSRSVDQCLTVLLAQALRMQGA